MSSYNDPIFRGLARQAPYRSEVDATGREPDRSNGSGATRSGTSEPTIDQPADDLDQAISRVQAAIAEFMDGRPAAWKAVCSHQPDATLFGAWGAYERGWEELGPRYDWASGRFAEGQVSFEELARHVSGDLACIVHLERARVRLVDAAEPASMTLRVTLILRREEAGWKLLHRHADAITAILPPAAVVEP